MSRLFHCHHRTIATNPFVKSVLNTSGDRTLIVHDWCTLHHNRQCNGGFHVVNKLSCVNQSIASWTIGE